MLKSCAFKYQELKHDLQIEEQRNSQELKDIEKHS